MNLNTIGNIMAVIVIVGIAAAIRYRARCRHLRRIAALRARGVG